ncbi:MAG: hypothetical protein M1838_001383 [Thelocarpon superellum]|nr:MAG: hypothetical protein M1838_001383 [Thelocarpon superellum]
MFSGAYTTAVALAALAVHSVDAIPKISATGAKFFTDDGNQFYIKGVAYQLTSDDPLIDTTQCTLDAALMKDLGANTIRVYHVDPSQDHSGCMTAFADNGIYLFVDLDTTSTSITQDKAAWTSTQLSAFEAVLDEFQKYDNTAGVFVGNEVVTMANGSDAAPYIKAAARDVKAYRDSKKYRKIPVGYSAADIATLRPNLQNYLACGSNASEALDFFSLNAYEWCGSSSFVTSGYSDLVKNATGYPIPIFLSETGCNTNPPRTFADQASIFGPQMDGIWSGAIVYEWIEESNNYGLVSYGATVNPQTATAALDGFPRSGTPTPVSPDFSNLKGQWATLTPSGVASSAYSPTNTPPPCPASTSGVWNVNAAAALPTVGQSAGATTSTPGPSATPSATKKGSSASGGKEVAGMSIGLVSIMLGFVWWL